MKFEDRDYLLLVDSNFHTFASQGWSDGYADLPNDSEEIIKQLHRKISYDKLLECVIQYLNGYEYGAYMSKHIDDVYDEDGNIKPGWDNESPILPYGDEAASLIRKYI